VDCHRGVGGPSQDSFLLLLWRPDHIDMASSLDAVLADEPASPDELDFNDADQDDILAENMADSTEPQRAESNASSTDQQPKQASSANANGKPNAKDPLRPRRKKARRACYACQRAHLTCGKCSFHASFGIHHCRMPHSSHPPTCHFLDHLDTNDCSRTTNIRESLLTELT